MIALEEVSRRFGTVWALRNINLEISEGTTVALLGRNGSGKSTLLRILAGLSKPTTGKVSFDGAGPSACKARTGYLGHEPFLYRYLSAEENLRLYADLYRVSRQGIPAMLEELDLASKGPALVRTFSRGETQRLGLARALLHNPDFLLLDEPFTGLDAASAKRLPGQIVRAGRTVVMSTHDHATAAEMADRLVQLEGGRLLPAFGATE